jgi:hypothetical protein
MSPTDRDPLGNSDPVAAGPEAVDVVELPEEHPVVSAAATTAKVRIAPIRDIGRLLRVG